MIKLLLSFTFVLLASEAAQAKRACYQLFSFQSAETVYSDSVVNRKKIEHVMNQKQQGKETVVVYMNALTYFLDSVLKIDSIEFYDSRLVGPAVTEVVKNPNTTVIYLSVIPITNAEVLHYIRPYVNDILKNNPHLSRQEVNQDILQRFKRVAINKSHQLLVQSVLNDTKAQDKILSLIDGRPAYIQSYTATHLEVALAGRMALPINASGKAVEVYGGKSGNHELFRESRIPAPKAEIRLKSIDQVAEGVYKLYQNHGLKKFVVKLEGGASGAGNALYTLNVEMIKGWSRNEAIAKIKEDIYTGLEPFADNLPSEKFWDVEFKNQKSAIVEEFIVDYNPKKDPSPSVQYYIDAAGRVTITSTHDQIMDPHNPQLFNGAAYPANKKYRDRLIDYGVSYAEALAKKGAIGHGGIDFVYVTKTDKLIAIENNARMTGTSHTYLTARPLQKSSNFHSRATDNFVSKNLMKFASTAEILNHPKLQSKFFEIERGEGVVMHMVSSHVEGKVGFTAIARTKERAEQIFEDFARTLENLKTEADPFSKAS